MDQAPLLSVNNIEVIYEHVILVLKGVSVVVPEGGIISLLGANGAGKSTTLKAISNLLKAERGEVTKGTIEFKGMRLKVELSGRLTLDWEARPGGKVRDLAPEGYIGLQNHDSQSPPYFRNVYIKEL